MNSEQDNKRVCHLCGSLCHNSQLNFYVNCYHIICSSCFSQNQNKCNCIVCGKISQLAPLIFLLSHQDFGKYFASNPAQIISELKLNNQLLEMNFNISKAANIALIKKITNMEITQKQLERELYCAKEQINSMEANSNYGNPLFATREPSLFGSLKPMAPPRSSAINLTTANNINTNSTKRASVTPSHQSSISATGTAATGLSNNFKQFDVNATQSSQGTLLRNTGISIGSKEKRRLYVHPLNIISGSTIKNQSQQSAPIVRMTPKPSNDSENPFPVPKRTCLSNQLLTNQLVSKSKVSYKF